MKIIPVFLFLSVLFVLKAAGGNDNTPAGGRSAGMGSASVALSDFWAVHNNQAGLAGFTDIAAGAYFENRFMMKELSRKVVAVAMPSRSGVFGLSFDNFGSSLYSENKVGLAFGRSFGSNFSAGIQLDYLNTHLSEGYGNHSVFTFEAGVLAHINKNLTLAAHIFNPLNVKLSTKTDERIPSIIRLGAAYNFSDKLILTGEAEKNIDQKMQIKSGVEYRVVEQALVRAGITTNPMTYTFGCGLDLKKLKVDISSTVHHVLGYSPQVSVCYYF
jgi:hypothetical protein